MRIGRLRGSFAGLGAWSSAQNTEAYTRLGALDEALGAHFDTISAAEDAGYPGARIAEAWAAYEALELDVEAIREEYASAFDLGTPGSWQSFGNHLAVVEANIAAFDPIPSAWATGRAGQLVAATVGTLLVASAVVGVIWLTTKSSRTR